MTTPSDVLAVAASKIGANDGGTNVNEWTAWYGVTGPWCAMFVSWAFFTAGLPLPASTSKGFAYCPAGQTWFKAKGRWSDGVNGVQAGDVVFWEMGTAPGTDHVEICERLEADGRITTIGGNVGNAVGRFTRKAGNVVGYGRPEFTGGATTAGYSLNPLDHLGPLDNPLDGLSNPLAGVTNALGSVSNFIGLATDPSTVRRMLYLGAGAGLMLLGSIIIKRDAILGVGKSVASVAAAVETGGASTALQAAGKVAR